MLFWVIGSIVVFFYRHILLFLSQRSIFLTLYFSNLVNPVPKFEIVLENQYFTTQLEILVFKPNSAIDKHNRGHLMKRSTRFTLSSAVALAVAGVIPSTVAVAQE